MEVNPGHPVGFEIKKERRDQFFSYPLAAEFFNDVDVENGRVAIGQIRATEIAMKPCPEQMSCELPVFFAEKKMATPDFAEQGRENFFKKNRSHLLNGSRPENITDDLVFDNGRKTGFGFMVSKIKRQKVGYDLFVVRRKRCLS